MTLQFPIFCKKYASDGAYYLIVSESEAIKVHVDTGISSEFNELPNLIARAKENFIGVTEYVPISSEDYYDYYSKVSEFYNNKIIIALKNK